MAIMQDKYPNLPGHLTEFKDGGLQLVQEANPPKTESVLILGTAIDGPVMEPVKVDPATAEAVFGKSVDERGIPNGSTVGLAFEEVHAGGCRDIRIMRISGAPSSAILKCEETTKISDAVFEGILGVATGNVAENSVMKLSAVAQEVTAVEADGALLAVSDYTFKKAEALSGIYTDGTLTYQESEVEEVKVIPNTKTIVVIATEDIYAHNTNSEEFKFESELPTQDSGDGVMVPDPTNYTLVTQKDIDYVVKNALTAKDAYVSGTKEDTFTPSIGKVAIGTEVVLDAATVSTVTIKDNKTNAGALVKVTYKTEDGKIKVENSSALTPAFVARGKDTEFVLEQIPVEGQTRLYINGAEYTEADTTVEDSTAKVFSIVREEAAAKLVLTSGKHAKRGARIEVRFAYKLAESISPELKLETSFAGGLYDETQYRVEKVVHAGGAVEVILEIIKPRSKRSQASEAPLSYSSFDCPTLGLLARAIANDARNGLFVKAYVSDKFADIPMEDLFVEAVAKNFTGGDNGVALSRQELFEALSGKRDAEGYIVEQGAYQLLENYTVDYVVPVGVYANEKLIGKFDNFAYELALFCAVSSHRNHATIGVISTTSPTEPTLKAVEAHVQELEAFDNIYYMRDSKGEVIRDSEGNALDLGKYINVIAGGDVVMYGQRVGQYAVNSAAAFAGYLSQLAVNSAPTNKVLSYAKGLKIKFSNHQLDRLTAKRFITLKYKGDGNAVAVVDAMTASAPGSDYARTATMRAVRELANEIREVADPFLGEPNTPQQRNALSSLLDKRLAQHKEAGTMKDYAFSLKATPYDELVGQATIELTIVPAQELRRITTVISLKPSL